MHPRMLEQEPADGVIERPPLLRIRVEVAQNDERGVRRETPRHAIVIDDVLGSIQVVGPETDLVVVALLIALLWAVEGRRCRVAHQEMNHSAVGQSDRHIPVALGAQAKLGPLLSEYQASPVSGSTGARALGHGTPRKS